MFVIGNAIQAVAMILDKVLWLYNLVIIAAVLISWVSPDPLNPLVRFLYRATEPVLRPARRWLPTTGMGLDVSPVIVLLVIYFLQSFLVSSLRDMALSLR